MNQIVTFSSRAIDNMSDIMDALNISSSASIKYGTIKGCGSASFVNENKVNESDINFIITVKVTNETEAVSPQMEFNPIEGLKAEDFVSVYGDCFVAGFLEGGEFSAIVSIKVNDKSNVEKVKLAAELQLAVGASPLSVGASTNYDKEKTDAWKDTETTISVNWQVFETPFIERKSLMRCRSGGGDIKKPEVYSPSDWTIVKHHG